MLGHMDEKGDPYRSPIAAIALDDAYPQVAVEFRSRRAAAHRRRGDAGNEYADDQ